MIAESIPEQMASNETEKDSGSPPYSDELCCCAFKKRFVSKLDIRLVRGNDRFIAQHASADSVYSKSSVERHRLMKQV